MFPFSTHKAKRHAGSFAINENEVPTFWRLKPQARGRMLCSNIIQTSHACGLASAHDVRAVSHSRGGPEILSGKKGFQAVRTSTCQTSDGHAQILAIFSAAACDA